MKRFFAVCLFLCFSFAGFSQTAEGEKAHFLHFKLNSQVPFNRITCLIADENNVKWIGTEDGFATFAGDTASRPADWRLYDRPGTTDTLIRKVSAIAIDANNHKWLAAYGNRIGLAELDPAGNFVAFYDLPKDIKGERTITGLGATRRGEKWVGTKSAGLWMFNEKKEWTAFRVDDHEELRTDNISSVSVDIRNTIWIGTEKGLCSIDDEGYFEFYDVSDMVLSIATDNDAHVCLNLIDRKGRQHLYCNNEDFADVEQRNKRNSFYFNDLVIDDEGVVWMAGNGIAWHKADKRSVYTAENSDFEAEEATALTLDADGNLWIGTSGEGLYKFVIRKVKEPEIVVIRPAELLAAAQPVKFSEPKIRMKTFHLPALSRLEADAEYAPLLVLNTEIRPNLALGRPQKAPSRPAALSRKIREDFYKELEALDPEPEPEAEPEPVVVDNKEVIKEEDIRTGATVSLGDINFQPQSFRLTNTVGVERLRRFMEEHPKVKIELSGHTDMNPDSSDPRYEELSKKFMDLSRERVETVKIYLTEAGIADDRIKTSAYGGTQPIENKYNSAVNRRVELKILTVD